MTQRNQLTIAIAHCLALTLAGGAQGADIFVADGVITDVDDGQCSIVEAIINANNNDQSGSVDCVAGDASRDEIFLPFDSVFTFTSADPGSSRALPVITSDITIEGNGSIITRASSAPEFGLVAATGYAIFESLTLSNGTVTAGSGGCVYVTAPRFRLYSSTVTGCSASLYGGGVVMDGTTARIRNSAITGNTAGIAGGGLYIDGGSTSLSGGLIADNLAEYGGGLLQGGGILNLRSSVRDNVATNIGGGVLSAYSSLDVRSSEIDGNQAANGGGGILIRGGTADLNGSTISRNRSPANGAGLRIEGAAVYADDITIESNAGASGGGIYAVSGGIALAESVVTNNSATGDGGGIRTQAAQLELERSRIANNRADGDGGGIDVRNADIIMNDVTLAGNQADASGGGIKLTGETATVTATVARTTFQDNVAGDDGGAIEITDDVYATMNNSTFADNVAGGVGGALASRQASFIGEHLTFSGNASRDTGENLWIDASGPAVSLRNSIVAAGVDEGTRDCVIDAGGFTENINNISEDGTCDDNETRLLVTSPRLEPLGRNGGTLTFALAASSPAIDAADAAVCVASDQRGVIRDPTACDIGAFELTQSIVVDSVSPGVGATAISGVDGLCSLPEAIRNSNTGGQLFAGGDECESGVDGASDRIILPASATFALTTPDPSDAASGLPTFTSRTTIQGNQATLTRDSDRAFRHIENQGQLNISQLTMTGGVAPVYGSGYYLAKSAGGVSSKGFGRAYNNGGSIVNYGDLALNQVTLTGNSADRAGGAISSRTFDYGEQLQITNSTLNNNSAGRGGAIYARGDATIVNSTLSGNAANGSAELDEVPSEGTTQGQGYYEGGGGGAILTGSSGSLTLVNSTLAFNSAETASGLYIANRLDIRNTIIVDGAMGGSADCVFAPPQQGSYAPAPASIVRNLNNLIEDGSCNATFSGSGQPLLDPLADNGGPTQTHALLATNNLAIDGGNVAACADIDFDQRGPSFLRSVDGDDNGSAICDIGAIEFDGSTPSDLIFRNGFD